MVHGIRVNYGISLVHLKIAGVHLQTMIIKLVMRWQLRFVILQRQETLMETACVSGMQQQLQRAR